MPDGATKLEKKQPAAREQPWAVRGVSPEARSAAQIAAKKAGISLGQWLDRAVRDAAAAEIKASSQQVGPTLEQMVAQLTEQVGRLTNGFNQMQEQVKAQALEPQKHGLFARLFGSTAGKPKEHP